MIASGLVLGSVPNHNFLINNMYLAFKKAFAFSTKTKKKSHKIQRTYKEPLNMMDEFHPRKWPGEKGEVWNGIGEE